MSRFIPNCGEHFEKMFRAIGVEGVSDLLKSIPLKYQLEEDLDLPDPVSELELQREFEGYAGKNTGADKICFLGAGAYDHFIPAAVDHILLRSEFYTAYTPYQAEVSQGTLQAIFEYQSMIARLTGMEAANASMYDGASASAEACLMAMRVTRKQRILTAGSLNPRWADVVRTYLKRDDFEINEIPFLEDGTLDLEIAAKLIEGGTAAILVQYPNYFGLIEDLQPMAELIHEYNGLLIVAADPVALPLLRSPGDAGADIVVGEGQSMGIPMSYGGPYIGFMATRKKLARKMPGRIIGRTSDRADQEGYVLTLQTREQHIRREKATSNICSNQALMALANTVYLSLMGESGFREVSNQCFHKSHYLQQKLLEIPGVSSVFADTPFFREFTVSFPVSSLEIRDSMAEEGILAGLPIVELGEGVMLITVTEKRTKQEMDLYVKIASDICCGGADQ
ncbi:MAG: aminomethyl-transferring glycine dehydrogenase subunit GcvPA [Candidatus Aegiribacteria sp.]|nr:aminomethyl-transferring glycine dehydrogenase subunit GcvPA [Candidatus Aegiribacteria sp.]